MLKNDIKNSEVVYDIDTDQVSGIASRCSAVSSSISSATIDIPGPVAKYASGILSAANSKSEISSALSSLKSVLLATIASSGESDVDYTDDDSDGNPFRNNRNSSSNTENMTKIDENNGKVIFEAMGWTVTGGTVSINGYTYDLKTGILTNESTSESIEVEYYVPNSLLTIEEKKEGKKTVMEVNAVDTDKLSKTNTITMLADNDAKKMSARKNFSEYSTNSILVVPVKKKNKISYTNKDNAQTNEIIASTEFSKAFSKQQDGCNNYIMGVSNGGGSALKIGTSDTYNGVIVINNKPLFNDGSTSLSSTQERLDEEDIKSYEKSGKPILFISAAKDGAGKVDNIALMEEGMEKIASRVNAKWITNNKEVLNKHYSYVLDQTTDIEDKNTYWGSFMPEKCSGDGIATSGEYKGQYYGHGAFDGLSLNFLNHGYLDGNIYNDDNIFGW